MARKYTVRLTVSVTVSADNQAAAQAQVAKIHEALTYRMPIGVSLLPMPKGLHTVYPHD